jgi:nucleoid-associated protein YgaU
MSLQPRRTGSGRISRPVRYAAPAILFLSFATFGAAVSRAQDQQDQSVAEAARHERARKQELRKRSKHVYTEEDLKHPNILTPEDRAQVEAKRNECAQKNNCSPAQNPPASLDANSQTPQIPLGDVARQLRKQKELQALKPKQSEPFHLPFSTPALAAPILPERPATRPPAQPAFHPKSSPPKTPQNVFRRDPFSAVPVRPEVRRPDALRPEVRRPESHPGPRKNVRPDLHTSVRENIRPMADPKATNDIRPKVREDLLPANRPNVHPDLSKDVRPILRAPGRLIPPELPRISSRPATPNIVIRPMQPSAPAKPAQPTAPIATVRPVRPQPAPSSVATATRKTVSVQRGDSLWKLAQQNLGSGNRWPELLAANPRIADPNQIRAGTQLNLPDVAPLGRADRNAKTNAGATIKIRKGDSLWTLGKSNLGRFSAWPCLAAANPSISDPNRIYENQELIVPAACTP